MAQWQDLQKLDSALQGRVSQLYDRKFPREIRQCLRVFIESQDWNLAAEDENKASTCFQALLVHLDELWYHAVQENNILQGPDFPGMRDYLLKHFEDTPLNLAEILSENLKEEKKILASASEAQGCSSPPINQKCKELDNNVNKLQQQTLEVKKEMRSLESLYKNLDSMQNTLQSQVEQHIGQSHAFVEEECLKWNNFITQTKQMVLQHIVNILHLAEKTIATLTDVELPEWKRRQQMACIGSPADTCLDHLQKWFSIVAETLLRVREQLQELQAQTKKYNSADASSLPEIEKFTVSLFTKLLASALVVEKQPIMSKSPRPLILKTGVWFSVTVRFLANLPEFKSLLIPVKPVFDKDVKEAKTVKGFRHFDFSKDGSKVLDVDSPCRGLVAEFGLKIIKETKTRTNGSYESCLVTEELHIIKFVTVYQRAGLEFNIEASSLPLVVISSTNQVTNAWASVMWSNVLSTSEPRNLSLFVEPPPLTWQQLSQVLSWQFRSVGQRELDENQLSMLRDKIGDDLDGFVHWSNFSKNENAWIWIDGILDLIKRHLVDLWRDGSIMGFVSRERAEVLLREKQTGTFLLRFSESNKDGAITFSWVDHCNGDTHVHAVAPYTKNELQSVSLPEAIHRYSVRAQRMHRNPLINLYPDIHKDIAFGRYYNTSENGSNGYVTRNNVPISENLTPPPSPPLSPPPSPPPSPPLSLTWEPSIVDMDVDMPLPVTEVFPDFLDMLDPPTY